MKRIAPFIPFVVAVGALTGLVVTSGPAKTTFILFSFVSVVACWLVVPVLSRRSLALGYLGLLLPLALVIAAALLDREIPSPQDILVERAASRGPK